MEFVLLTGMSGAGKTNALHAMEDIGFYCVDNLPPLLLGTFYDLCEKSADRRMKRVAVVADANRALHGIPNHADGLVLRRRTDKGVKISLADEYAAQ